jgi:5-methyltetrahydrofolate--homocysteine methyltransferase
MNPYSQEMQKAYHGYCALMGLDEHCASYIAFAQNAAPAATTTQATGSGLHYAVTKGLKERAAQLTAELIAVREPLAIIQEEIIPALNEVGTGFENKTVYLPQLLMSAEAAKAAFEAVKAAMPSSDQPSKGKIVLATVKGDIHDIGKNIVRTLLSNYGYEVIDLGKDVPPQKIVDCALEHDVKLVGLSALMTTTVPAMEETIALLRKSGARAKVVVGGAVLTQEYADMIHADHYAKDAMETVRYAEELFAE